MNEIKRGHFDWKLMLSINFIHLIAISPKYRHCDYNNYYKYNRTTNLRLSAIFAITIIIMITMMMMMMMIIIMMMMITMIIIIITATIIIIMIMTIMINISIMVWIMIVTIILKMRIAMRRTVTYSDIVAKAFFISKLFNGKTGRWLTYREIKFD